MHSDVRRGQRKKDANGNIARTFGALISKIKCTTFRNTKYELEDSPAASKISKFLAEKSSTKM